MPVSFAHLHVAEPPAAVRRLLWHVLSVGQVSRDEPECHAGHDKAGAHLFWVVSGTGCLQTGAQQVPLASGPRCWVVNLAQERQYLPNEGKTLVTAGFRFSGPGVEAWREALGGGLAFELEPKDFKALRRTQQTLLQLIQSREAGYEWRCHQVITDILGRLLHAGQFLAAPARPAPEPVARVIRAVLANPAWDWKALELADIAGISYSGLRSLFKTSQQEGVHEFLQRNRLDQARLLLGNPALSVKEVAHRLHFSSEVYFSHFFRKAAGISPSAFRAMQRE